MDHDAIESILYEQGLKRLKKILPEGKSGQPMDFSRSNESSYKYGHPVNHKGHAEISSRDRFATGNGIPISIRCKKLGNEEISMQRDHNRRDRLQQTFREPPSMELEPKRLKVRGPSFLGLESSRSN